MPVKKQTVINLQRPAGRGVLQTTVSLKRAAVSRCVNPLILHRIDNFRKYRITGDVPSLKRFIYERSPASALGKGLRGAAKNVYRMGSLPGRVVCGAGLAGEDLIIKAGAVGVRQSRMAIYQKIRNSGDNDTGRALAKTVSGVGTLLFIRRERLMARNEIPELKKKTAASKRRLRKSAGRFKSGKSAYKKKIKQTKKQIKNYKKAVRGSAGKSRTRLINKRRGAKRDYKLFKKTYKSEKKNLRYAKKIHRENKRLLRLAKRGKATAALGLSGRKLADKFAEAAQENDTTAVVSASVYLHQQIRETRTQKLFTNQKRVSKLKKKSVKNQKDEKLRRKSSKLNKKGAGSKSQSKKRRRKTKKGFKNRLASIISALSNPGDVIKNLFKGTIAKAVAAIIIPALPFILVGFAVFAIIISFVPQFTISFITTYQAADADMLRAYDELKIVHNDKLAAKDKDIKNYYVDGIEKTKDEMYAAEFLDPHMLISFLSIVWFYKENGTDQEKESFRFTGGVFTTNESKVKGYINIFYERYCHIERDDGVIDFDTDYENLKTYIYNACGEQAEGMFVLMYEAKGNRPDLF